MGRLLIGYRRRQHTVLRHPDVFLCDWRSVLPGGLREESGLVMSFPSHDVFLPSSAFRGVSCLYRVYVSLSGYHRDVLGTEDHQKRPGG